LRISKFLFAASVIAVPSGLHASPLLTSYLTINGVTYLGYQDGAYFDTCHKNRINLANYVYTIKPALVSCPTSGLANLPPEAADNAGRREDNMKSEEQKSILDLPKRTVPPRKN
jgi:hypothetical protein